MISSPSNYLKINNILIGIEYLSDRLIERVSTELTPHQIAANSSKIFRVVQESMKILEMLKRFNLQNLSLGFIEVVCKAYGQLSYLAPAYLVEYDSSIKILITIHKISCRQFNNHYWNFKFVFVEQRDHLNLTDCNTAALSREQLTTEKYYYNAPIYFHRRLLCEFTGENLLLGGGRLCECGSAATNHSEKDWFSIDIDTQSEPDVILHAGLQEHLQYFPSERFQIIWLERSEIDLYLLNQKIFLDYFRILRPGGVLFYQSSFYSREQAVMHRDKMHLLTALCSKFEMAILEQKECIRMKKPFSQFIAMKPFLLSASEQNLAHEPTSEPLNFQKYRKPILSEQQLALIEVRLVTAGYQISKKTSLSEYLLQSRNQT